MTSMNSRNATANSGRLEDPRRAGPSWICRALSLSILSAANSQRFALSTPVPQFESIVARIRRSLDELRASRLQPIINGTGIVIHTNFGRAPLRKRSDPCTARNRLRLFESRIRSCDRRTRPARQLMSRLRSRCFAKPKPPRSSTIAQPRWS